MEVFDDLEQTVKFLRKAIDEIPKRYQHNNDAISKCQQEINDLLHYMEFCDLGASKGYEAYKETQAVLRYRRQLKNENALIEPLKDTITKMHFDHKRDLDKSVGEIRKVKTTQGVRSYRARVRSDLEPKINGVK